MYIPFEAGCVFVRDREAHRSAFQITPSYMSSQGRGVAPRAPEFAALGIDMARELQGAEGLVFTQDPRHSKVRPSDRTKY